MGGNLNNFIPKIWAAQMFIELEKKHVFGNVVNTDHEGEIKAYGDTVYINSIGDISVGDYVKNVTEISPQELEGSQRVLVIDQAKYFAFKIDDIDKAQQKPKVMSEAMRKAAYALRNAVDLYFAGMHGEAHSKIGAADGLVDVNSKNIIDVISTAGQLLDEQNVPLEERWMVIPPWFHQKMVLAKILETQGSVNADDVMANGYIGKALGFNFHLSNNVAAAGQGSAIMAGTRRAITFAQQILNIEAYRPENSFADAVKGLYVYGGKVIDPKALVTVYGQRVDE